MIICFRCSKDLKSVMDELVEAMGVGDYKELIELAIMNLRGMDMRLGDKDLLVLGTERPEEAVDVPVKGEKKRGRKRKINTSEILSKDIVPAIPPLFRRKNLLNGSVPYVTIHKPSKRRQRYRLEEWVFGQYNKFLPLKVNSRALAKLTLERGGGIDITEAANALIGDVIVLTQYLKEHDLKHGLRKQEGLSTAFPSIHKDPHKSIYRYVSQFVGAINKVGELGGMLHAYKFLVLEEGNSRHVLLTDKGLEFAAMENPVLDESQREPNQKFSGEEVQFLLGHIRDFVPEEAFAFKTLLRLIMSGKNTPERIDRTLSRRKLFKSSGKDAPPNSFLVSQRAGGISRLADLGLIAKVKDGISVHYEVTDLGREFVS